MLYENLTNNSPSANILNFVKQHLRIISDEDNVYLSTLIKGVIERITNETYYSPINNTYKSSYVIDLVNNSSIINSCCEYRVRLPIIYPFFFLNDVKVNEKNILPIHYELKGYFIDLKIELIKCAKDLFVELTYSAGEQQELPADILLLIALETEKIYSCGSKCDVDTINTIYFKYNKKRFL